MAMTALQTIDTTAVTIPANQVSALPSIAEVKQRMTWMTEFRPVLLEYVQTHMDPARHMYSFENNRYTPMTFATLKTMMAEGKKPALNQDGLHNLMSLYDCYPDEPTIHDLREDGFYTCRATIKLISFRTGLPMGAGTGSCSTRESRYAYRWVGLKRVPKGVGAASLRQRELSGRSGDYTQYRLENEDIADVESTVLQMAVKRAKSAAVKALPLVSEMFAGLGDVDEATHTEDEARQAVLAQVGIWMRSLATAVRMKAVLAVFGQPLRVDDVAKLDEETLIVALQTIEIATTQGVHWESPTLAADLQQALATSAAHAKEVLFGHGVDPTAPIPGAPPTTDVPGDGEAGETKDVVPVVVESPQEGGQHGHHAGRDARGGKTRSKIPAETAPQPSGAEGPKTGMGEDASFLDPETGERLTPGFGMDVERVPEDRNLFTEEEAQEREDG